MQDPGLLFVPVKEMHALNVPKFLFAPCFYHDALSGGEIWLRYVQITMGGILYLQAPVNQQQSAYLGVASLVAFS
jgi:hypothetical protein